MKTVMNVAAELKRHPLTIRKAANALKLPTTLAAQHPGKGRYPRVFTDEEVALISEYLSNTKAGPKPGTRRSKYPRQFHTRISGIVLRARSADPESDLTSTVVREMYDKQRGVCAYTSRTMGTKTDANGISLVKKDATRGYSRDNVELVVAAVLYPTKFYTGDAYTSFCKEVIGALGQRAPGAS